MSWRTFLAAHWGAIAAADFFTTEIWTLRGLVTYYTLFVIDLASRRVQIVGSSRIPMRALDCRAKKGQRPEVLHTDGADRILAKHKQLEPLNGMLRRTGGH
jgi:hypothetical protein